MRAGLAWILQLGGLVVVGTALLVGLAHGALRTEVAMLAVGAGLFLLGRVLERGR